MKKDRVKQKPIIAVVGNSSVESAFRKYGAEAFNVSDERDVKAAIRFADGIAFTGGGDVSPSRYSDVKWHPNVYGVSDTRDDKEFKLAAKAMKRGIPMFGICRGLQLLNVAHGGTLHQDIDEFTPTFQHFGGHDHEVILADDSGIYDWLKRGVIHGTSYHHQAVDRIAPNLQVVGWAPDGIVEMIESQQGVWPYVLATQFHPEMDHNKVADKFKPSAELFKRFIHVAAGKASRRKDTSYRMEEARKMRFLHGSTTTTYHYGNTSIMSDWENKRKCPHGFRQHCSTDTCKFDKDGYSGYLTSQGVSVTMPDSDRCEHGYTYHSDCPTTPPLPGSCTVEDVTDSAKGDIITTEYEQGILTEQGFEEAVERLRELRELIDEVQGDAPSGAIPRVGATWDDARQCWMYDQSEVPSFDDEDDWEMYESFKARLARDYDMEDVDNEETCAFPPCMDKNACSPKDGDCLHAIIASGEQVSIATVKEVTDA